MISEIEYKPYKELEYSSLILNFKINNVLMNAIRRTILNDIPTYAIPRELIKIETDTTIYNRDQLTLRLSQLPVLDIDTGLSYLEPEYYEKKYDDLTRKIHPNEKDIKFYVHGKNNDILKKYITTNDLVCYIDGKKIETKYSKKYPILLTVLRKDEEIDLNMKAVIGCGLKEVRWCPVSKCYFTYEDDANDCKLYIYSKGQISEYDIIRKALENIIFKLNENKLIIHNFINDFLDNQKNNIDNYINKENNKNKKNINDDEKDINEEEKEKNKKGINLNLKNNKIDYDNEEDEEKKKEEIEENELVEKIKITFDNLTIGLILNYFLQNDSKLFLSGIYRPTYLLDKAILIIKYSKDTNIIDVIDNNIDKAINLFNDLLKQINKIKH